MHSPEKLLALINEKIEKDSLASEPSGLYEPIRYIMSLGGKRIRPVMLLMACDLFDGDLDSAMPAALGIEIFHNFSLVHDDIMDRAPLRRGKPTVHEKWNANTAILSGDTMLVKAYEKFLLLPAPILRESLEIFSKTATGVCEGQQYDMDFETADDVSIASYLEMIRLKTAVLLGAAFELGALAAGAPAADRERLCSFGVHTGIVFQLRDDLLDTYGDADLFGKKQYGDIVANKKTYLYLKTLESLGKRDRNRLIALYSDPSANPEKKVQQVLKFFDSVDVKKRTEEEIILHYHKAQHCLEDIDLPEVKKKSVSEYTEGLMGRKY